MGNNQAIVIGINQYDHLQPLNYAKRDAEQMKEFLEKEAGFSKIFFFSDDSPPVNGKTTRPCLTNLLRVLQEIFESPFMKAGDNFWFFFSGHGVRHAECDYLMPSDGYPGDIEKTTIKINYVTERLRRCGADNVVMILDACRNQGNKSGEGIGKQTAQEVRSKGIISIASCHPDKLSYEIDDLRQGVFTHALLEGLGTKGQCGTVEQLNDYLTKRLPKLADQYNKPQQFPYVIAEPIAKSHLILLPRNATLQDIATLKNDAYDAEYSDPKLAKQLWIRILQVTGGNDRNALEALDRLGKPYNIVSPPQYQSNSGSKRVVPTPKSFVVPQLLKIRDIGLVVSLLLGIWLIIGILGNITYGTQQYPDTISWAIACGSVGGSLSGLITALGLQKSESSFQLTSLGIFIIVGGVLGGISWFILEFLSKDVMMNSANIGAFGGAIVGVSIFLLFRSMR